MKTASTHIQAFAQKWERTLKENNIYWAKSDDPRDGMPWNVVLFTLALDGYKLNGKSVDNRHIIKMKAFIERSKRMGRNIVISSEVFSFSGLPAIRALEEMLVGFDVKILHLYREPMSHMLSIYNQNNKYIHGDHYTQSFGNYLVQNMNNADKLLSGSDLTVLRKFTTVFGKERIIVIDMIGNEQTGRDIAYAVFCEVLGVLCTKSAVFETRDLGKNGSEDLTMMQIFSIYHTYVKNRNNGKCHYCDRDVRKSSETFFDFFNQYNYTTPVLTTNLSMVIPYMDNYDERLRHEFGNCMLHNSRQANLEAIRKNSVMRTLDIDGFFMKLPWMQIFEEGYRQAAKKNLLCDC